MLKFGCLPYPTWNNPQSLVTFAQFVYSWYLVHFSQLSKQIRQIAMAGFFFLGLCLLSLLDSTGSLRASTVRELSGLYSKTNHHSSAVKPGLNTALPVFANVSEACQKAFLALPTNLIAKCKCEVGSRRNSGLFYRCAVFGWSVLFMFPVPICKLSWVVYRKEELSDVT